MRRNTQASTRLETRLENSIEQIDSTTEACSLAHKPNRGYTDTQSPALRRALTIAQRYPRARFLYRREQGSWTIIIRTRIRIGENVTSSNSPGRPQGRPRDWTECVASQQQKLICTCEGTSYACSSSGPGFSWWSLSGARCQPNGDQGGGSTTTRLPSQTELQNCLRPAHDSEMNTTAKLFRLPRPPS